MVNLKIGNEKIPARIVGNDYRPKSGEVLVATGRGGYAFGLTVEGYAGMPVSEIVGDANAQFNSDFPTKGTKFAVSPKTASRFPHIFAYPDTLEPTCLGRARVDWFAHGIWI